MSAVRFPYIQVTPTTGNAGWASLLPLTLRHNGTEIDELALVDSGSAVNVLPYDLGIRLGLDWNSISTTVPLTGMLAGHQAKAVLLEAVVTPFPALRLAFGWSRAPGARLLLGQTNFFMEFDVFFARSRSFFEIQPAIAAPTP